MKRIVKFTFALLFTAILGYALFTALAYIDAAWTVASMEQARNNLGNQVAIRASMRMWNLVWWGTLIGGFSLIGAVWYFLYRKALRNVAASMTVLIIVGMLLTSCSSVIATKRVVLITPPNYGLVISMSDTSYQVTGNVNNRYEDSTLMTLTQQEVNMKRCSANSTDFCPDKIVTEIPGSYVTRLYSRTSESGTSISNQALCFEANGANGCVDFTVTAIVLPQDVKCYPNLMGTFPAKEADGTDSRFHFMAMPLAETLDVKLIGIASEKFSRAVADISPLRLALEKYSIFEGLKQGIADELHKQTCVSITNMGLNSGVTWTDQEIQDQINQATVISNQMELVARQNELAMEQMKGFIDRALELEKNFGTQAAVEFMKIQKWDGKFLPYLPGSPSVTEAVPVTPVTPVPLLTPTAP